MDPNEGGNFTTKTYKVIPAVPREEYILSDDVTSAQLLLSSGLEDTNELRLKEETWITDSSTNDDKHVLKQLVRYVDNNITSDNLEEKFRIKKEEPESEGIEIKEELMRFSNQVENSEVKHCEQRNHSSITPNLKRGNKHHRILLSQSKCEQHSNSQKYIDIQSQRRDVHNEDGIETVSPPIPSLTLPICYQSSNKTFNLSGIIQNEKKRCLKQVNPGQFGKRKVVDKSEVCYQQYISKETNGTITCNRQCEITQEVNCRNLYSSPYHKTLQDKHINITGELSSSTCNKKKTEERARASVIRYNLVNVTNSEPVSKHISHLSNDVVIEGRSSKDSLSLSKLTEDGRKSCKKDFNYVNGGRANFNCANSSIKEKGENSMETFATSKSQSHESSSISQSLHSSSSKYAQRSIFKHGGVNKKPSDSTPHRHYNFILNKTGNEKLCQSTQMSVTPYSDLLKSMYKKQNITVNNAEKVNISLGKSKFSEFSDYLNSLLPSSTCEKQKYKKTKESDITISDIIELSESSSDEIELIPVEGKMLNEVFTCTVCYRTFKEKRKLNKHILRVHGEPSTCNICQKTYNSKFRMQEHRRRMHTTTEKCICSDCGLVFDNKYKLTNHISVCHMSQVCNFKCSLCTESFITNSRLVVHLRQEHGVDKRETIICETCGKTAKSKTILQNHIHTHTGEKQYVCEECGKSFRTDSNLEQHSRTHSDIRPYSCDLCGKSFRIRHHLKQHLAVHGMVSTPAYGKRKMRRKKKSLSDCDNSDDYDEY